MYSSRHSTENLPEHFLRAMRTLFDIMDVERSGYIRYDDLARRWADNPPHGSGIPAGFMESLREVTPPNGMLTFERFRAGLRLALARSSFEIRGPNGKPNQDLQPPRPHQSDPNLTQMTRFPKKEGLVKRRSPPNSKINHSLQNQMEAARQYGGSQPAVSRQTTTVPTHYSQLRESGNYENMEVIRQQKKIPSRWDGRSNLPSNGQQKRPAAPPPYSQIQNSVSAPKLNQIHNPNLAPNQININQTSLNNQHQQQQPPTRPSSVRNSRGFRPNSNSPPKSNNSNYAPISRSIPNEHLKSESSIVVGQNMRQGVPPPPNPGSTIPGLVEGANLPRIELARSRPISIQTTSSGSLESGKKGVVTVLPPGGGDGNIRWRENRSNLTVITDNRRHTVTDGMGRQDSISNKQMKLLAEEKELLQRGLEMVAKLKNWYHERLGSLETRQKYAGKSMIPLDYAVHEEKLNFLRAHVTEVNRKMNDLVESSERGFPAHFNLELPKALPNGDQISFLKKQNQQLTEEVSAKSDEIEKLDCEKAELQHRLRMAETRNSSQGYSSLSSGTPSPPFLQHSTGPRQLKSGFPASPTRSPNMFPPLIKAASHHHVGYEATLI